MNFLTVFIRPPGDLIYYVLIMAVILACALMAASHHIRRGNRSSSRLMIGLVGALVVWLLLMGGALVNVLGSGDGLASLQALERAAYLLMIVAVGWAFITADGDELDPRASQVAIGLAALAVLLLVATGNQVNAGLDGAPPLTAWIWALLPIAFLAGGIAVSARYRELINDAPLKIVFAAVLLIGYTAGVVQYITNDPQSVLGSARLAFAAALVLAALITYRALVGGLIQQLRAMEQVGQRPPIVPTVGSQADRPSQSSAHRLPSTGERESIQLLRALGLMIEDTRPTTIPSQIVRAALEMLRADIGALIRVQDANYADIVVGFDRTRKRTINGLALNLNDQPTLQNAIERQQQRPLFPDRNQAELDDLYTRLSVEQTGPAYLQPLARDGKLTAILLVGFPFSDRELTEPEAEALKGLGVIAAGLLSLSDSAEDSRLLAEERAIQAMVQGVPLSQLSDEQVLNARQSALAELQKSRQDIDMLSGAVRSLEERVSLERERLAMALGDTDADMSISQRVAAVSQQHVSLRTERDQLAERLRQMESALSGAGPENDDSALRNLITSLQEERDELASQRARLETQLVELRAAVKNPSRAAADVVVTSIEGEQTQLTSERDQLRVKFERLQAQLAKFGVDGSPSGIAQLISQLYGERASLMGRITTLASEKETLAQERSKLNQRLVQLRDSEQQITQLQREINNVASDREAIVKQRDALKQQRDELVTRFEAVKKFRERVVERITMLENQIKTNQERFTQMATEGNLPSESGADVPIFMELSKATSRIVELERELNALRIAPVGPAPSTMTVEESETLTGLVQELRTPITSMRGYVDLMLKESVGILGDTQRKFLQRIAVNVGRLSNMIEDMVRIAALDTGRVALDRIPVDFVEVVEEAMTEINVALREKGIELDFELADGVPNVIGDRDALKQVALQLLTNAYLAASAQSVMRVTMAPRDVIGQDGERHLGTLLT
ncbi:MAG: hypothetical protein KA401_01080, partial [Anaerolineae bacterium]|nr:hypothetical protein [Anaerolineae bacterium]